MNRQLIKDALGWGVVLWMIGYVLGIVLFMLVPLALIGWIITPIGIVVTLWVLIKKIKGRSLKYYLKLGVIWVGVAVVLDYFLLVKLFEPADGYYKVDVYLYYLMTFVLPLVVGWRKFTIKAAKTGKLGKNFE